MNIKGGTGIFIVLSSSSTCYLVTLGICKTEESSFHGLSLTCSNTSKKGTYYSIVSGFLVYENFEGEFVSQACSGRRFMIESI